MSFPAKRTGNWQNFWPGPGISELGRRHKTEDIAWRFLVVGAKPPGGDLPDLLRDPNTASQASCAPGRCADAAVLGSASGNAFTLRGKLAKVRLVPKAAAQVAHFSVCFGGTNAQRSKISSGISHSFAMARICRLNASSSPSSSSGNNATNSLLRHHSVMSSSQDIQRRFASGFIFSE